MNYRVAVASAAVFQQTLFLHVFLSSIWIHRAIIPTGSVFANASNISNNNNSNNKSKTGGWFSKVIGSNFLDTRDDHDNNANRDDKIGFDISRNEGSLRQTQGQQQQQQRQQQQKQQRDATFIGRQPFLPPPPPPPLADVSSTSSSSSAATSASVLLDRPGDDNDRGADSRTDSSSSSRSSGKRALPPPPPPLQPPPPPTLFSRVQEGESKRQNQTQMYAPQSRDTMSNMDMSQPPLQPPLHNDYDPLHYRQQQEYQQEGQSSMGTSMPYYESNPPTTMGGGWMYDTTQSLKYEMDQLMFQQHQLYSQIQNLTISLYETERSKEMQQSQIDLLLEQVADAEAYASAESNAALEYKANCTALGNTVSQLQQEIENWEQKCQQVEEDNRCKEEEIETLKEKLKRKEKELENMACGIELARLEKQKQAYHAEYEKKKSARHRGLFHWLFGWIYGDELSEDDSDEELEKLQEQARSTLLTALQAERNNVEELENALELEKQNNTAIAEMVASRDSLIDELNDRVAVFEEDKVVLKAALRQLQKEMKEEAPKTQKIVSELKAANAQIKVLEADIDQLKKNHTDEVAILENRLQDKQKQINETDSKMAMISVYVDQLEERLASFAVARRDIAVREKECDKLVNRSLTLEEELSTIKVEAETLKTEQTEMRNLVDLLIQERTELQNEKVTLNDEKEKLLYEGKALREELDILNDNFLRLEKDAEDTQQKLEDAREIISSQEKSLEDMEKKMLSQQEEIIEQSANTTAILQQEIQRLEEENRNAINMIGNLEDMLKDLEGDLEEAREKIKELSTSDRSSNTFIVQPPPPPSLPADGDITTYSTSEEMHTITREEMTDVIDQQVEEKEDQSIIDQSLLSEKHEPVSCLEFEKEVEIPSDDRIADHSNESLNYEGLNEESFDDEELVLHDSHEYFIDHHDDDLSEPDLPNDNNDLESSAMLTSISSEETSFTTRQKPPRVPFRTFRKKVSKITGIHGFFSKPTSKMANSEH